MLGLFPESALPSFNQVNAPAVSFVLKSGDGGTTGGVYVFVIVLTTTFPALSTVNPGLLNPYSASNCFNTTAILTCYLLSTY